MMILDKFLNVVLVGETMDKIGRLGTKLTFSFINVVLSTKVDSSRQRQQSTVNKSGFQKWQISVFFFPECSLKFNCKVQSCFQPNP